MTMKRCWLVLGCSVGLVFGGAAVAGCKSGEKPDEKTRADDDENEKKVKADDEGELPDLNALAQEASFGHHFDDFSGMTFGAVDHSPLEPANFSPGWIGQESYNVLQMAKDGDLKGRTVTTGDGRVCLVFTDDGGTIRRAMLASRRDRATEELAFAENGNAILWYRHNRDRDEPFEEWAYFHRGQHLNLYQSRKNKDPRKHQKTPLNLKRHILDGVKKCIQKSGANNPLPGASPPPAPTTPKNGGSNDAQPQADQGGQAGGLAFGALAFSKGAAAWRLAHRKVSAIEANKSALEGCSHDDCAVTETFGAGECLSVVHGPPPMVVWGKGSDADSAERAATQACSTKVTTLGGCDVKGTWCNDS